MIRPPTSPLFAATTVFVAASVWGLYWMPLRWLKDQGLDGLMSVAAFNLAPALVLSVIVIWRWRDIRGSLPTAVLIGACTGLGLACYAAGLVLAPVVRATLLFYLTPVWGTLIGWMWLNEQLTWSRGLALLCGFLGLAILVTGQGDSSPLGLGDVFGFLSGLLWAIGATLILRRPGIPVVSTACFQFIFATLGALAFTVLLGLGTGGGLRDLAMGFDPMVLVFSLAVMATVLAIFWAQKQLSPGRAGLLMMSEVLVAIVSASWLLPDERMPAIAWLGAVLIVGSCLIEVLGPTAKEVPA